MPTSCAGRKKSKCSKSCKWASGSKRSFCRKRKNKERGAKKPASPCASLKRKACHPPTCTWAKGKSRKFCRVSKNKK